MVFAAGPRDSAGKPRISTNVCPSKLLEEDGGEALETFDWWHSVTPFDGMSGAAGLPEWPLRGSMLKQPARLVEAVQLLRHEWNVLLSATRSQRSNRAGK